MLYLQVTSRDKEVGRLLMLSDSLSHCLCGLGSPLLWCVCRSGRSNLRALGYLFRLLGSKLGMTSASWWTWMLTQLWMNSWCTTWRWVRSLLSRRTLWDMGTMLLPVGVKGSLGFWGINYRVLVFEKTYTYYLHKKTILILFPAN